MPRPLLSKTFGLHYRKIPVLSIGREVYCDTTVIIEALEHYFPASQGWGTVYPKFDGVDEWVYRGLVRGFASFWVDKPLFRTTTGLIPPSVWRTSFGTDRSALIGHTLDPEKLGAKIPQNLSTLDLHLSLLEPTFKSAGTWAIPTKQPSLADISLYYQLRWGIDIAAGKGIYNLTGGGTQDTQSNITDEVFNEKRYPGIWNWFHALEAYLESLPDLETTVDGEASGEWKEALRKAKTVAEEDLLVPTEVDEVLDVDVQRGLESGAAVSIAPDDTGRDDPTVGTLVKIGVQEIVIKPVAEAELDVRIHFPRLGFVVKIVDASKL
ncbi:hypothetical protein BU24DRAFT_416152 [Aaosphaeria arxii CBS 175.79]|uniref:DUF7962 domain-containing protein n=1 Tax=Aaosphaeria arxii CBS 175.79 TaxID=1450172 RepID=A0A6A5Y4I3_9PLEO|nr:uncharacterized protein BU24DRAFT_416152 [Aaosphaeria arxii CBS 175.79]KAF2020462.1 hypothetical protein BU24DRAFT_416152 [Aaosphaeria arxii CBS 175.79]